MVKIKIEDVSIGLEDADDSWIIQQIQRRRDDGLTVRIRIIIDEDDINMVLSTPSCPSNGGVRRLPRRKEKELQDLWKKWGLNDDNFSISSLIAFIKQLKCIV